MRNLHSYEYNLISGGFSQKNILVTQEWKENQNHLFGVIFSTTLGVTAGIVSGILTYTQNISLGLGSFLGLQIAEISSMAIYPLAKGFSERVNLINRLENNTYLTLYTIP